MRIFLFVLLLPFFAALGHDVYVNHLSDDKKIRELKRFQVDVEEFQVSDLGWVWKEYSPDSFDTFRASIDPDKWNEDIDPVLQMPTMVVSILPFIFGAIGCLLVFGYQNRSTVFAGKRTKKDDMTVYKHAKDNAMKFKRK